MTKRGGEKDEEVSGRVRALPEQRKTYTQIRQETGASTHAFQSEEADGERINGSPLTPGGATHLYRAM